MSKTDGNGYTTPGTRVVAPTDGARSGAEKMGYVNKNLHTPPKNSASVLSANSGLFSKANSLGDVWGKTNSTTPRPSNGTAPSNTGAMISGANARVPRKEFENQTATAISEGNRNYGPSYSNTSSYAGGSGLNATPPTTPTGGTGLGTTSNPTASMRMKTEAARTEETSSYYNNRLLEEWRQRGGKDPSIEGVYEQRMGEDGQPFNVLVDYKVGESSGLASYDDEKLQEARIKQGFTDGSGKTRGYGDLESTWGENDPFLKKLQGEMDQYRRDLDRNSRSGIFGENPDEMTDWGRQLLQFENERDARLELEQQKYNAQKGVIDNDLARLKQENTDSINTQMEDAIGVLKSSGQIVVDAMNNMTAGSQQLIDKVRGSFEDRLSKLNESLDSRHNDAINKLDSQLFENQSTLSGDFRTYAANLLKEQRAEAAGIASEDKQYRHDLMVQSLKDGGIDGETANDITLQMGRFMDLTSEEIQLAKPAVKAFITKLNGGIVATDDQVNAFIKKKDYDETMARVKKLETEQNIFLSDKAKAMGKYDPELLKVYLASHGKNADVINDLAESWTPPSDDGGFWSQLGGGLMDLFRSDDDADRTPYSMEEFDEGIEGFDQIDSNLQ